MYSLLWKIARPLLRRHKRLRDNFAERLVPPAWPHSAAMQAAGRPADAAPREIWLQAASGGEAYLAWELAKELAARAAGLRVLCTTCTRQGLDVLHQAQLDPACAALSLTVNYLPLDEKAVVSRAVAQAFGRVCGRDGGGRLLALLETEIWPGLLAACARAGVSVVILNARMTESSYKAYRLFSPWLRRYAPAAVLATTEGDLRRFCEVFDPKVRPEQNSALNAPVALEEAGGPERASGVPAGASPRGPVRGLMRNLKFDRLAPLETRAGETLPNPLPPGGLILLASVRREEEDALLEIIPGLLARTSDAALALAPRHLHRVEAWRQGLDKAGVPVDLRSAHGAFDAVPFRPGRVLLWDAFGELGALYRLASAVFVGGSLAPLGGQNFLEALGAGLVPCIGPYWSNFAWAGEELFERGLVRRVNSARDLTPALLDLLRRDRPREEVKREFAAYLAPRRGGVRQAADLILKTLAEQRGEGASGL